MTISQCMIVKNEEKNIKRALAWGRDIVFEQIVVDTGSTDRTVEIAQGLGAKIFHFEWVGDFAAAKNFAIEQASGDWIAFLDADEYMSSESVRNLTVLLKKIESSPQLREKVLAITCDCVNLDDNNQPQSVYDIVRVVKNAPSMRYVGIIHEQLIVEDEHIMRSDDFEVVHTGYAESAIAETNKHERNIELLRKALKGDPNNIELKLYLADSLKHKDDEKSQAEAEKYFKEGIETEKDSVFFRLRIKAYIFFLNKYVNDESKRDECERLARKALSEYPCNIDFEYFLASVYNYGGRYKEAWELLKDCEKRLENRGEIGDAAHVPADMTMLYGQLILAAQGLKDAKNVEGYALKTLKLDKSRTDILNPLLITLSHSGKTEDEVIMTLKNVYDFENLQDLLFIAKSAKNAGAISLAQRIVAIAQERMKGTHE
ncbi:MAG: glycosyltransferase [Oscillospiraceae bacterium]|nr:glycosyltransferase [Oscillospiraceae bacterium]